MSGHIRFRIDPNPQPLRIRDDISNIQRRVEMASMTEFLTRVSQTILIGRPQKREALRIVYVPVEDVEVVSVQ